jgi:hypothetical protein
VEDAVAIRIHFVGGESVEVEDETLRDLADLLSGEQVNGTVEYAQQNLLVVLDKITHAEAL